MEYIKEDQILLYEELCCKPVREDEISKATIKFRENVNLANYVAGKFSAPYDAAISKDDILQDAYLGLWKACLGFDESKGLEFSTYAVPMIRGHIMRDLRDNEALKIPRSFKDIRNALHKHGFTLPLSDEEIDILVGEKVASRKQIMSYAEPDLISIDSPIKEYSKNTYADIIPGDNMDIGFEMKEEEIEGIIDHVLSYIKPQHRDLVEEWMYSVLAGCRVSQEILGIKYNISQPKVSRVLRSAIDIVRMNGEEIRSLFGL